MESTSYEYTVSFHHHQNLYIINLKLTCTEILRRRIRVADNLLIPFSDQTKIFYTGLIRVHTQSTNSSTLLNITRLNGTTLITRSTNNSNLLIINYCDEISQILNRFGVTHYGCSTILSQIDDAVKDLKERGGVIEVNVWKIMNVVDRSCGEQKRLLIERIWSGLSEDCSSENSCVICMEDYEEGSMVSRLRCDHEFHGICIKEWLKIDTHCPLCRSSFID